MIARALSLFAMFSRSFMKARKTKGENMKGLIKIWYHIACCKLWIIAGHIAYHVEVGTTFGWHCVAMAKKHANAGLNIANEYLEDN